MPTMMKKLLYMLTTTVRSSIFSVTWKDRQKPIHDSIQESKDKRENTVLALAILTTNPLHTLTDELSKWYVINVI